MSISTTTEVVYPESDGKPVGETDLHIDWLFRLRDMLKYRYRDQQVYVAADLLLYYEEGNPRKFVVPDVFVVKACDPGMRRTYKVWEEPSPPHVVIELTSLSSRREDTVSKPDKYALMGIPEYFVYDPTSDYLDPPLRGFRLTGNEYVPIEPDAEGVFISEELDFSLRLDGVELVLCDRTTGEPLLMQWEAEQQALVAKQQALAAEQQARLDAEAEIAQLREQLRQSEQNG